MWFVDHNYGWLLGIGPVAIPSSDDRTFRAVVLYTTDGGWTWVEQSLPPQAKLLRSLKFVSPTQGWGCGRNGTIIHTTDGGNSWILQNSGVDSTLFDIDFADSLRGIAAGSSAVIRTTDGGASWQLCAIGIEEDRRPKTEDGRRTTVYGTIFRNTLNLPPSFFQGLSFGYSGQKGPSTSPWYK